MKGIELLKQLRRLHKPFFSIADLEKITGLSKDALHVALKRWTGSGLLERIGQGIYLPLGGITSAEKVAAQIYIPNYLSFESALSKHGILNLIPYSLTFATVRKTRKYTILDQAVEFRQIKREFFFGFEMRGGIYLALPEKAFLDEIYFLVRGKTQLDFDEVNLKTLSIKTLKKFAGRFPPYVQKRVEELL